MGDLLILIIIVLVSIFSNSKKKETETASSSEALPPSLNDIFDAVGIKAPPSSGMNSFSDAVSASNSVQSVEEMRLRKKKLKKQMAEKKKAEKAAKEAENMTAPSKHQDHNCDDVNYDKLGSLTGGFGSFGLASESATETEKEQISMTREDLLKSFVMSEVLQRYDLNRIYSRIPSVNSNND